MHPSKRRYRPYITALMVFWSLGITAQDDRTFPNVSAEFTMAWPCIDGVNGPYTVWEVITYSAQPSVQHLGLEWGAFGSQGGRLAVDGDRVLLWGPVDVYVPQDSIVQLYDFGLAVGDTAYYDYYYTYGHAVVVEVEVVQVLGRDRRRLELDNGDVWLEGVGSLFGVVRPLWMTPLGCADPVYTFCAEYADDQGEAYTWCSNIILGVPNRTERVLNLAPNPSNGSFTVRGGSPGAPYQLRDLQGRTIQRGSLMGGVDRFDLHGLPAGIYLFHSNNAVVKVILE
ncbi:MAG: T9SS type A sorting domain-containing protein [Flavobacteriales bacterium]|nr:T9SS type A sorting domain-containing protein [Flavobacteriales bacterium]